ncbi:mRNA splicing protein [Bonamia ostreae]|uniref:Pre-mRNA-splicing factor SLU7 n=1 Tax=Bonamia ostreae TaxID=126728 RepID=A0ABV2AKL1_9EUKA
MSSLQRLTREDYKRKKELDELRKAGAAPAEVDDEGNMINPHIPQYMAEAPWYVSDGRPGLRHLKKFASDANKAGFHERAKRGAAKKTARRYRPGACRNCGAMGHSARECCERPRKRGARWTGEDIKPDRIQSSAPDFDYDGKRDRWREYDLDEHKKLVKFSERVDAARKEKQDRVMDEMIMGDSEKNLMQVGSVDGDNIKDPGLTLQIMNEKKRQTVRNLRTREDTAKYLLNLDPNSAFYDPKTRSMRSNPFADVAGTSSNYIGDNFTRVSGDAEKFMRQDQLAGILDRKGLESQKGIAQMASNPTKSEMVVKKFVGKLDKSKNSSHSKLMRKYGGAEHFEKIGVPTETFKYREFDEAGNEKALSFESAAKTKYLEDALEGGHSEIWGSFYDKKSDSWGFACCHSLKRANVCKGII